MTLCMRWAVEGERVWNWACSGFGAVLFFLFLLDSALFLTWDTTYAHTYLQLHYT